MPQSIDVTVVTSPGCHFCDEALHYLDELSSRTPLRIEKVPLFSEKGRTLLVHHRIPFPPIVLVDGELFGHGRISRRKLEARLERLMTSEQVG